MINPKIQVIFKKEDIKSDHIDEKKVVVVFDVLLATTTIATLLKYGATEIIPVLDGDEALKIKDDFDMATTILSGESMGLAIPGFVNPLPTRLKDLVFGKKVILSTTNGTVALRKSTKAKKVYAASLVNGDSVAARVVTEHLEDTIIVICSGSMDRFSLEDFYGAGYFIHELMEKSESWDLTDSAKAALYFYRGNQDNAADILTVADTGQMLMEMDCEEDIIFSAQKGTIAVVPELIKGRMVLN